MLKNRTSRRFTGNTGTSSAKHATILKRKLKSYANLNYINEIAYSEIRCASDAVYFVPENRFTRLGSTISPQALVK